MWGEGHLEGPGNKKRGDRVGGTKGNGKEILSMSAMRSPHTYKQANKDSSQANEGRGAASLSTDCSCLC